MNAKFVINKRAISNDYYWELLAPNGQVIAKSAVFYTTIHGVENAISVVKKYAENAEIITGFIKN